MTVKLTHGLIRVFTSTMYPNPKPGTGEEASLGSMQARADQQIVIRIQPGTRKFFFSVYGVEAINKYVFKAHIYDLSGELVIG